MKETRILWVSRHKPLLAEITALREKLGEVEIDQFAEKVPSAEWLTENIILPGGYRYVVVVLPLSIIARLVELGRRHGFHILHAKMELLHNDYADKCPDYDPRRDALVPGVDADGRRVWRHYRFSHFEIVEKVELVTRPL